MALPFHDFFYHFRKFMLLFKWTRAGFFETYKRCMNQYFHKILPYRKGDFYGKNKEISWNVFRAILKPRFYQREQRRRAGRFTGWWRAERSTEKVLSVPMRRSKGDWSRRKRNWDGTGRRFIRLHVTWIIPRHSMHWICLWGIIRKQSLQRDRPKGAVAPASWLPKGKNEQIRMLTGGCIRTVSLRTFLER